MRALLLVTAISVIGLPATAFGQEPSELPPVDHNQVLSSNLLGVVAQWFNVEFERKTSAVVSFGVSGSAMTMGDSDGGPRRANVFMRFYPQGAVLSGVFIGLRGGGVWNRPYSGMRGESDSGIAAGIEIGRTRLLGKKKNVAISTGFGLDRAWFGNDESYVIPNVRLFNIGIAF